MKTNSERSGTKRCRHCGRRKPFSAFYPRKGTKALYPYCRACGVRRLSTGERCEKIRLHKVGKFRCTGCEKVFGVSQRGRRERCKKCSLAASKNKHYRSKYGIDAAVVTHLARSQEGKCGLCDRPWRGRPHLDHNHRTGKVRAVLCHRCNILLGFIEKTPGWVKMMASYMKRHGGH